MHRNETLAQPTYTGKSHGVGFEAISQIATPCGYVSVISLNSKREKLYEIKQTEYRNNHAPVDIFYI